MCKAKPGLCFLDPDTHPDMLMAGQFTKKKEKKSGSSSHLPFAVSVIHSSGCHQHSPRPLNAP